MKYTQKFLERLANSDMILFSPKKEEYYDKLLLKAIKRNKWKIESEDDTNDIVSKELWFDLCEVAADLAYIIVDERKKHQEKINNLVRGIESEIYELKRK
jgi:ribonuclease HI